MNSLWNQFERVCQSRRDETAVFHGSTETRFAELLDASLAVAASLNTIHAGDRVLLCGENSAAFLAVAAGIWHRGAIPALVHADAPQSHLEHAVAITEPAVAFAETGSALAQIMPCRAIELPKDHPTLTITANSLPDESPGSIVFTSGSSGLPKGVTQSAGNLLDGSRRVSEILGYTDQDRILCPIPFAFDYGWGQALSVLLTGKALVLPQPRNAFGLCQAIELHQPTVFAAVPAVMAELTSGLAPIATTPRDSIRLITNTGSKIADAIRQRLLELFPEAAISLNYGLTETYRSACLPVDQAADHPGSVGFALPGAQLDVLRPDGSIADPMEEGEIVHSGAGTFVGYWGDRDRTSAVRRKHPQSGKPAVFTGDLGHKDAEGRLYIHGRRDRQLKSMGVRVAPDEIEALLLESGLLSSVAISALPHDMIGDMIVACVVPKDESQSEKEITKALRLHARMNMSTHMQPRKYIVLGTLPETRSAKTDYFTLAKMIQASA